VAKSSLIIIMRQDFKCWDEEQQLFANADKAKMTDEIAELVSKKKKIEKEMKEKSTELTNAWCELQVEELKFGKLDRTLQQQIEEHFLECFKVTRGAYHGSDLTGGSVKKLMQNAHEIGSEFEKSCMV